MKPDPELRVNVVPELDMSVIEGQLEEIKTNPFNVHVDVVELLDHFDGDEAAMFGLLGKLKDFLS